MWVATKTGAGVCPAEMIESFSLLANSCFSLSVVRSRIVRNCTESALLLMFFCVRGWRYVGQILATLPRYAPAIMEYERMSCLDYGDIFPKLAKNF